MTEERRSTREGSGPWKDTFSEVQEMMNEVLRGVRGFPGPPGRHPRLDLVETPGEGYRVLVDLPGVERDAVEVTTVGDELTIAGERRRPEMSAGSEVHRSERGYGRFRRSIRMPPDVDADRVTARFDKGVLEISLPREEAASRRTVDID